MQPLLLIFALLFLVIGIWQYSHRRPPVALSFGAIGIIFIFLSYLFAPKEDIPEVQPTINIRIVGSKTIGTHLMPDLVVDFLEVQGFQLIDKEEHPDLILYTASSEKDNLLLKIQIEASGSLLGFEALFGDNCEISMSSDRIDSLTMARLGQKFDVELHEHLIAFDAIQIIVHPAVGNKLGQISREQLHKLLIGQLNDWSELHPDLKGPIKTVLRDSSSGSYHFMKESLFPTENLREDAIRLDYFEKISAFVESDSMAMGFVNYALDTILLKNVEVIGVITDSGSFVKPTLRCIQDNRYPLARKLYLYNSSKTDNNSIVQSLLQFCKSPAAIEEVRRDGLVPVLK